MSVQILSNVMNYPFASLSVYYQDVPCKINEQTYYVILEQNILLPPSELTCTLDCSFSQSKVFHLMH